MYSRTSSIALVALLATSCGEPSGSPEGASISCAIGPGAEFGDDCILEHISKDLVVIHRPDGGFRRLTVEQRPEGPMLALADGAERLALVRLNGATRELEIAVNDERYRMDASLLEGEPDE